MDERDCLAERLEEHRPRLRAVAYRLTRGAAMSAAEADARANEGRQDAELVRVAAYAGPRRGELVALRWRPRLPPHPRPPRDCDRRAGAAPTAAHGRRRHSAGGRGFAAAPGAG
jgi:hypothetical protein